MNVDRPTVADALPLARAIYERHAAGCCLHVVLDDDNLEQRCIDGSVELARERGHADCLELALMLRSMTASQRGRVRRRM